MKRDDRSTGRDASPEPTDAREPSDARDRSDVGDPDEDVEERTLMERLNEALERSRLPRG